jgi:hypothetical protein
MASRYAYTAQDVETAIQFVSPYKNKIWAQLGDGRVRFSLTNGDKEILDTLLSRPLTYKEDWEQLKKQMRRQLSQQIEQGH